jgi:hypothetical protein
MVITVITFLMVMESGDLIRVHDEFSCGFDW